MTTGGWGREATYEVTFEGTLPACALSEFDRWRLVRVGRAGRGRLVGAHIDQAALHGALDRLDLLGLRLLEVRRCPTAAPTARPA